MLIKQNGKYGAMVGNIRFYHGTGVEVYKMFAARCYADLTMEASVVLPMWVTICTALVSLGLKLKIWNWRQSRDRR